MKILVDFLRFPIFKKFLERWFIFFYEKWLDRFARISLITMLLIIGCSLVVFFFLPTNQLLSHNIWNLLNLYKISKVVLRRAMHIFPENWFIRLAKNPFITFPLKITCSFVVIFISCLENNQQFKIRETFLGFTNV